MTDIRHLQVYSCTLYTANSDGEPVEGTQRELKLLFNNTRISTEEVCRLIDENRYEFDPRVIIVTQAQIKWLQDEEPQDSSEPQEIEENFYKGYKG